MDRNEKRVCLIAAGCMLLLIFDSRQTILAASEAVELCIRTAIPSLFPFFVLSGILVPGLAGRRIPVLQKCLQVPQGWESIFLLSCVGGYPVGAQCIAQGCRSGQLSKAQAQRMLGFCNNCGPAFLFGVIAPMFPHPGYGIALTVLSILSAIAVGSFWPPVQEETGGFPKLSPVTLPSAVRQAISSMASVCAWIVLGKILLHDLDRWFFRCFPGQIQIILGGMLELTNGCINLAAIENIHVRFLAASILIPFGGLCVAMQVSSICGQELSWKSYLPQKLLQCSISALFAWGLLSFSLPVFIAICAGLWILFKFSVAFRKRMMYNGSGKGGFHHAVPKEN